MGYRALRDDLGRIFSRTPREKRANGIVTALRDVSFEVPSGQALALIGDNGAGKSTALKIVSRITYPSAGRVSVKGRVGALIEVGTGLHQELTGRENVQLYGRILGMSGRDIRARFDQIVEFSGLGPAIDQPVKQYSSGMELRLGFSVAAHLEPDVLIVDEAISVGDAAFQYRCVERMSSLVREGRTLLFVTHNLAAAEALCERALLLSTGEIDMDGTPRDVVHEYLRRVHAELAAESVGHVISGGGIEIREVSVHDRSGASVSAIRPGDPLTVRVRYLASREIISPQFSIGLADPALGMLAIATMLIDGEDPGTITGDGWIECTFSSVPFKPRTYEIVGEVRQGFGRLIDWQRLARFQVEDEVALNGSGANVVSRSMKGAPVALPYRWRYPRLNGSDPLGREQLAHMAVQKP
jgi:ABC-type polysaccharide/polyol phosphate transport system ATPase subunit